jgi:hypothetical protein
MESFVIGPEDMCEHGVNSRVGMMIAERRPCVIDHKRAQDLISKIVGNHAGIEKMGGVAALKIWAEGRQPFGFINALVFRYSFVR